MAQKWIDNRHLDRASHGELDAEAGEEIEAGLFEGDHGFVWQVFFSGYSPEALIKRQP